MAAAVDSVPANNYLATTAVANYQTAAPTTIMNGGVVEPTGGQPHENRMPSLAMTWVIALTGVYPSRT
jgi:microcystin-dependent protein